MKQFLKSTEFEIFITLFLSVACISLTTRFNGDYGVIQDLIGNIFTQMVISFSSVFYAMSLAKYDSTKIFKSHTSRGTFRLALLSFLPAMMTIQSGNYYNLLLAFYACTVFYVAFEMFYNDFKKQYLFYIGDTAIHDKIIRWINKKSTIMMNLFPTWYITWKLALFFLANVLLSIYWY